MRVGILALQGAFLEHEQILDELGIETAQVRLPHELNDLDGLIIPGGESTTIAKLAAQYELMEPLADFANSHPVWGTCAGMIFLAKDIGNPDQSTLSVMDIAVDRNAFGRQIDSFEENLHITCLDETPFHAVFIRAPKVTDVGEDVKVLATTQAESIVAVQQGHWLATAFHPELTQDNRLHQYFCDLIQKNDS